MTVQDIWSMIQSTPGQLWALIVICLMSLIQISPIKFDPWTLIGRFIGKFLGIAELKEEIQDMKADMAENKAIACRVRILRFGDEIRQGTIKHSKESFDQVLDDIANYDNYCSEHKDFANGRTVATTKIIQEVYHDLILDHKL